MKKTSKVCGLISDRRYTNVDCHTPGIEPWITSFLFPSNGTLLDLGCGLGLWGYLIKAYINSECRMVGLDISADKLRKIHAFRVYDDLVCANAECLPFVGNCFDLIISIEVLQNLLSKLKTVSAAIESIVKEDGRVIISMPFYSLQVAEKKQHLSDLFILGYDIFAVYFRGLFVLRIRDGTVSSVYRTFRYRLASMLLSTTYGFFKLRMINYLIILKVKARV